MARPKKTETKSGVVTKTPHPRGTKQPHKTTTDTGEAPKKRIRHSYLYATGRRKKAVARTRLFKTGSGKITVNNQPLETYFPTKLLQDVVTAPLQAVSKPTEFDFSIRVQGGGKQGQAEAARLGIARALLVFDKDLRPNLKAEGLLRRDPRRKERKKPGLKKARRAPQFSKR